MRSIEQSYIDFSGGMTAIRSFANFSPRYSRLMQNCYPSEMGGCKKVPGYGAINVGREAERFLSGFEFVDTDGTKIKLVAGGGKIYKIETDGELTQIHTGLNTSAKVYFFNAGLTGVGSICIILNGIDAPLKYDGTTVSLLGGTPPSTAFKGVTDSGLTWMIEKTDKTISAHSDLNNPEDYTGGIAGFVDLKYVLKHGEEITDVAVYNGYLVFFLTNHIAVYSISFDPTTGAAVYTKVQLIHNVGLKKTDMCGQVGNDFVVMDNTGIRTLSQIISTGELSVGELSTEIDPDLRTDIARASYFSFAHYKKLGWFLFLVGSVIWVYRYDKKAWFKIAPPEGEDVDIYGMFTDSDGKLYFLGQGYVYEFNRNGTYAFNGKAPIMVWQTGWLPLTRRGKAYPRICEILNNPGASTSIQVDIRFDLNSSVIEASTAASLSQGPSLMDEEVSDIWENVLYMDSGDYEPARISLYGRGNYMQLLFSEVSIKGPVEINEIKLTSYGGNKP